jgi:2-polyprenyl-6-hydroxyphenyl methylase / 3-demethylubiquinone-9 3-methyltransferase
VSAALWLLPFGLQGVAMGFDTFACHRAREVPRGEGLGHALDTAVFLACLAFPLFFAPTPGHLGFFGALAAASCLLITKDEFIHQRLCTGVEHWFHAVLFLLHPLVLAATALLWLRTGAQGALLLQAVLVAGFLAFQLAAWALEGQGPAIDNSIYGALGERWYTATDDPVALLRAEARLRTAWILEDLEGPQTILDVACGGGFLANPLAQAGHAVTGVDLSPETLDVAARHDPTRAVTYLTMDARKLSFLDAQFDVVCMMDFLEHLPERDQVLAEAARVLKPGGRFYFHTFSRTPLSWLVVIQGVAWFVRNTPKHMHVYSLFLKPGELAELCARHDLEVEAVRGVRPRVFNRAFLGLLFTGRVSDGFRFAFTRFLGMGYCGRARKQA